MPKQKQLLIKPAKLRKACSPPTSCSEESCSEESSSCASDSECPSPCSPRPPPCERGAQGFQGNIGLGPQGPKGKTGCTGCRGKRGPQGFGPQGMAGSQGPSNDVSSSGPQGFQGPADSGAQGWQGPASDLPGPQGPTGEEISGPQGPEGGEGSGPQGPAGEGGENGPQGPSGGGDAGGPQGPVGGGGAQGVAGFQGLAGVPPIITSNRARIMISSPTGSHANTTASFQQWTMDNPWTVLSGTNLFGPGGAANEGSVVYFGSVPITVSVTCIAFVSINTSTLLQTQIYANGSVSDPFTPIDQPGRFQNGGFFVIQGIANLMPNRFIQWTAATGANAVVTAQYMNMIVTQID